MADFRKWLFALAVVALLAGFTVPASAQTIFPITSMLPLLLPRNPGDAQAVDRSPPTPTCSSVVTGNDLVVNCKEAKHPITQAEIEQHRKAMTMNEWLAWLKDNHLLACNLLFPYVTQAPGYDTGIAIANTTPDEPEPIQFFYYNAFGRLSGTQTSNKVAFGQVLQFDLSTGSKEWGLSPQQDFVGYVIAQTKWPSCHGFAVVGNHDEPALSEGYLALVIDAASSYQPPLKE